ELFPENEQVKNSLAGLANAIEPGGIPISPCERTRITHGLPSL
ncbi:class I SAM-dependent methyltransferase family protein, partial [Escherichia sp. SS-MK2]